MTNAVQLTLGPQTAQLHDVQTGILIGSIEAGYQAMSDQHFKRSPLDAGALERAIEWTEDRIQMARLVMPAGARLITQEAEGKRKRKQSNTGTASRTPQAGREAVQTRHQDHADRWHDGAQLPHRSSCYRSV